MRPTLATKYITIIQIQDALPKRGAKAINNVPPAPTTVRIFNQRIFTSRRSAITPNGGLIIATESVEIAMTRDNTASAVIDCENSETVRPFALRNKRVYHTGIIAKVTLHSKADFPQS